MRLLGIATRKRSAADMELQSSITVSLQAGLDGDFRGQPGKRQVTVLSEQSWRAACDELGVELPWTLRRANLLISDASFSIEDVGKIIQIGDLKLQITRETDPCRRMDAQHQGLMQALMPDWRGGVCCRVLAEGDIRLGDTVVIR